MTFVLLGTMLSFRGPHTPYVPLLLSCLCAWAPDWSSLAPIPQRRSLSLARSGVEGWTARSGAGVHAVGHRPGSLCCPPALGSGGLALPGSPLGDLHTSVPSSAGSPSGLCLFTRLARDEADAYERPPTQPERLCRPSAGAAWYLAPSASALGQALGAGPAFRRRDPERPCLN